MALSNLTRAAATALRKQRTPATAILVAAGSATRMGGIDKVMALAGDLCVDIAVFDSAAGGVRGSLVGSTLV